MPSYDLYNSPIMQKSIQDPATAEFLRGAALAGGMPQLQEAVADEQAQANFNRDMANNALMAEMANRGAYNSNPQSPALVQGFMPGFGEAEPPAQQEQAQPQQPQTLTQMARQKALDIIKAKNLYAQGAAMGGEQGEQVMQLAHAGAERARGDLQQLGVDPAQYGLNGTYDEAAQGLASNDMRAMQNILDGDMGKSSIAHYDDMYNYLIEQGASREIADQVAAQRARSYAIQRVKTLEDAFNMYGHNGQVINPMGIQILQKLGEEEPDMATYYTQRYAGPLQEYAKATQRENAAIQHQYGKEDRADAFGYDVKKMGIAQEQRKELKNIEFQMQEAHANNNVVREVAKAIQLYEAQAKYGIGKGASKVNGVTKEQVEYAAKMIESIDKQLANGFDLSEEDKKQLQAQKAQYKSVVDAYMPFGQQNSGGSGGKDYNLNDYNDAMAWAKEKIQENADKNYPYDRAQLRNMFRNYIGDWADDVEFGYGDNGSSSASNAAPTASAPAKSYPAVNVTIDNGDYGLESGTRGNIANSNIWGSVFNALFPRTPYHNG